MVTASGVSKKPGKGGVMVPGNPTPNDISRLASFVETTAT